MRWCKCCAAIFLVAAALSGVHEPTLPPAPAADAPKPDFQKDGLGFIQKYCLNCHGDKVQKADLALHVYTDEASVLKGRKVWQNVLHQVQTGEMPQKGKKPTAGEIEAFNKAITGLFQRADSGARDPGRVTIRRLNRAEYNNTIRDLVGVDFNPAEDFPSDDVGHGFDNIGDVLSLSPVLMERYLAAAESIVNRAILVGDPPPSPKRRLVAQFLSSTKKEQFREVPFRSLDAKGEFSTVYKLTHDGDYKFRFRGWEQHAGTEHVKVSFTIDGKEVGTAEVKANSKDKAGVYETKPVPLTAGDHRVGVSFVNEFTEEKEAPKKDDAKKDKKDDAKDKKDDPKSLKQN